MQVCFCFAKSTLVLTLVAENCKKSYILLEIKTGNDVTNLFGILGYYATCLRPFDFLNRIISLDFTTEKAKKRALFGLPVKPEMT